MGQNIFSCTIVNNTNYGIINLQSLTNGISDPPVSSGNPPLLEPVIQDGETILAIQVSGGEIPIINPYNPVTQYNYPNTTGTAVYNLPDNVSTLTISWDIPTSSPSFQISNGSPFKASTSGSGNSIVLTIEKNN